jgi:hypothetical protein
MSPIVDLPVQLVAGTTSLPPLPLGGTMGNTPLPLPGRVAAEKINPAVTARVQAMLTPAISKLGGTVRFSTILGYAHAAGQTMRYPEVVLSAAECQEYMSVGRCADLRCTQRHTPGAVPEGAKIDNFIAKMQPIIGYILNTPEDQLRRRVRQRR